MYPHIWLIDTYRPAFHLIESQLKMNKHLASSDCDGLWEIIWWCRESGQEGNIEHFHLRNGAYGQWARFFSRISSIDSEKKKIIRSACASGSMFIDITQRTSKHIGPLRVW